ncbi:MAG: hypothetical protein JO345_38510 [Streptosporangiaceae bacterium]|nr:hypothetical protein [Streptosporangiaceae bacterium]
MATADGRAGSMSLVLASAPGSSASSTSAATAPAPASATAIRTVSRLTTPTAMTSAVTSGADQ